MTRLLFVLWWHLPDEWQLWRVTWHGRHAWHVAWHLVTWTRHHWTVIVTKNTPHYCFNLTPIRPNFVRRLTHFEWDGSQEKYFDNTRVWELWGHRCECSVSHDITGVWPCHETLSWDIGGWAVRVTTARECGQASREEIFVAPGVMSLRMRGLVTTADGSHWVTRITVTERRAVGLF